MADGKRVGVVIPAAGFGRRMGGVAKQFLEIDGKPLLAFSLRVLQDSPLIDRIVIAGADSALDQVRSIVHEYGFTKVQSVVAGGEHRQDSVWNGIQALPPDEVDLIAVHDAARPMITQELVHDVVQAAGSTGGAILAIPCNDTVKQVDGERNISGTVDRSTLWFAQTPQVFAAEILVKAFTDARASGYVGTDEASLVERIGGKVTVVPGTRENIKITTGEDLVYLQALLEKQKSGIKLFSRESG